jgi:TPR repeat protein
VKVWSRRQGRGAPATTLGDSIRPTGEWPWVACNTRSVTLACRAAALLLLTLPACSQLDRAARRASAQPLTAEQQRCVECSLRRNAEAPARDAVAHFGASCSAGDLRACSVLGVMYEQGQHVDKDEARAKRLFSRACRGGNAAACVSLGKLCLAAGHRDEEAAALTFELGCDAGEAEGCYQLGLLRYQRGEHAGVRGPLSRACRQGHASACEGLGAMYLHGHGVKPDLRRAQKLMRRACRLGSSSACDRDERPLLARRQ